MPYTVLVCRPYTVGSFSMTSSFRILPSPHQVKMPFLNCPEDYAKKTRSELSRIVYKRKAALAKARLVLVRHEVHLHKVQAQDNGEYTPHVIRYAEYLVKAQKSSIEERESDLALVKALFIKAPKAKEKK